MAVIEVELAEYADIDGDQGLDKRRRNRMGDHLKQADAALSEWGLMYRNDSPRAWSRTTLLGRVMEFGNQGAASSSPPPTNIPRHIEIVDKVFAAVFPPLRQRVVLTVYAWRRGCPMEQQRLHAQVGLAIFKKEKNIALENVRQALLMEHSN